MVGADDDRVALEERLVAAGRLEQLGNRPVGSPQRVVRALRAGRVRRVVVVGQVVDEEVEAVT